MKIKLKLKSKKGIAFTLIELIVVVAIIALLASLVIFSLNSVRMKGRDVQRVSHMNSINQALRAYYNDHGFYPATLNFGQPFRNADGNKTYLDEVPQNPSPRTDHNCPDREYVYTASTDKKEYSLIVCTNKQGDPSKPSLIFSGQEGLFHCGDLITDLEENTYKTITIGTQCWMAQNLKTKFNPDGSCIIDGSQPPCPDAIPDPPNPSPVNPQPRLRTCLYNTESNCTLRYSPAPVLDGAFYMWDAAMNHSTTEKARGICPIGWHIPSDNEWYILESYVTNPGQPCNATRIDPGTTSCAGSGTRLRYPAGSSGFNAVLTGYYGLVGGQLIFDHTNQGLRFISSSQSSSSQYISRMLWPNALSNLWRFNNEKNIGSSLRCIKD